MRRVLLLMFAIPGCCLAYELSIVQPPVIINGLRAKLGAPQDVLPAKPSVLEFTRTSPPAPPRRQELIFGPTSKKLRAALSAPVPTEILEFQPTEPVQLAKQPLDLPHVIERPEPAFPIEQTMEPSLRIEEPMEPAFRIEQATEPAFRIEQPREPAPTIVQREPAFRIEQHRPAFVVAHPREPAFIVARPMEQAIPVEPSAPVALTTQPLFMQAMTESPIESFLNPSFGDIAGREPEPVVLPPGGVTAALTQDLTSPRFAGIGTFLPPVKVERSVCLARFDAPRQLKVAARRTPALPVSAPPAKRPAEPAPVVSQALRIREITSSERVAPMPNPEVRFGAPVLPARN
jgi:hypothetical protein